MKKILIVADDLTGALDSATAFAARGLKTLVLRRPEALPEAMRAEPDVLAIATGTRELPAPEAVRIVEAAIAPVAGWADIVLKKVDSRLKGHIADEVAVVARLCKRHQAVIAPAIPEFGRIVRDGLLTGHGLDGGIDIAGRFAALALPLRIPTVAAPDDFTPLLADLDSTLLVGARGLAAALAQAQPEGGREIALAPQAPLLIAIGSRDPITLAQVDAIRGKSLIVAAPNGTIPPSVSPAHPLLIQMTQGHEPIGSAAATALFSTALAELADRMAPATIFASGGETADGLLGIFGVNMLEVAGEFLPGIPMSRFRHHGRSLTLVTKSGGFGPPETLEILLRRIAG
ncbi:four-carbon acid sugar kinase family protein [Devosia sp. Root635]|uniref:four-carbon acid sugar kinase family protein n=1 Tax=Devosia sp. Root635 TaxID=1736575 RepID=UPI0006F4EA33|nr:four-carbon acid sugar kinase family protein [Devosia sp. Root635]KRA55921.1 hypothetical protein ASD80_01170 [Devosia sp. Root635]